MSEHPPKTDHGTDHPPEKADASAKKSKAAEAAVHTETDKTHNKATKLLDVKPDHPTDPEKHPRLEHTEDEVLRWQNIERAQKMEEQLEPLRQQYDYTVPRGATKSFVGTGIIGGAAVLATSLPAIGAQMMKVGAPTFAPGTPIVYPNWVGEYAASVLNTGIPLGASVFGAYGGSLLGAYLGRKVAKHTGLTENQGHYLGKFTGMGIGGVGTYVGTNWLMQKGFSNIMSMSIPNFSTLAAIPGGLLGYWAGGKVGESIGKHVFHHPGAGRWIGRIGGGFFGAWGTGAAGSSILPVLPGAAVAGAMGLGAWGLGRTMQNVFGWERKNVWRTMLDGPKGAATGVMNTVSWLGDKFIRKPSQGFHNAIMNRPSHGVLQKLGAFAPKATLGVPRAISGFFNGFTSAFGVGPNKYDKNGASNAGGTTAAVVKSPYTATKGTLKWLLAPRGGGGGHDAGGHGGGH